jgi:hypothetical protein
MLAPHDDAACFGFAVRASRAAKCRRALVGDQMLMATLFDCEGIRATTRRTEYIGK